MGLKVDLHSHTTASDGATPPRELVRLAKTAGVDVLGVTDHDSVDAVGECLEEAKAVGIRVLPGIEMSSRFEGRDVHVLGLGIDWRAPSLLAVLDGIKARRRERVERICAALRGLGVPLAAEEVFAESKGKSVGRKHVARAVVKKGLAATDGEVFDRWLGKIDLPVHELPPQEAATLIRAHGGIAVLAHPGFFDDDALVERILDAAPSIRGIEVWHRYDSPRKHLRYLDAARRRNLRTTGGSDFHGDVHPHNAGLGAYLTPPDSWKNLENGVVTQ
ncbi:MAG TPA: PHP domain-containing protein [Planctomycetota bacterium]